MHKEGVGAGETSIIRGHEGGTPPGDASCLAYIPVFEPRTKAQL